MEVTEEKYLARLLRLFHHQFCVVVDRVKFGTRAYPLSVQVLANQGAPIIADDDSIWVEHRYDFEHEGVPQLLRLGVVTDQEVYASLHHVGSI